MDLHFSSAFGISAEDLEQYGAFDISVVSDLPLFIDPFLLFNSDRPEYQELHDSIIRYLVYLRDKSSEQLDDGMIDALYRFKEVRQNWLGFTLLGNRGSGLGRKFAESLHRSLRTTLRDFGEETITESSHLEKLCLIRGGVGRDNISDFTTNLIKDYLCEYTSAFAREHIDPALCDEFGVERAVFNYDTETWATKRYWLPKLDRDFVLLTPSDMLTRDDTWISHPDMIRQFDRLPNAVEDGQLRAQINQYFRQRLGRSPSASDRAAAAAATIERFPELIDRYIREKEESGDQAETVSRRRVQVTDKVFVRRLQQLLADLESRTDFYDRPAASYPEALARAMLFKRYVEHQDGWRLINPVGDRPPSAEKDVQLFFGLAWFGSELDVNREVNNGRGPVDFKVSSGAIDKSLIEFKLGSNSQLKRNLQNQVAIYKDANQTPNAVKVIVCYTAAQDRKVARILKELGLTDDDRIVVVDARNDNKPSASKA